MIEIKGITKSFGSLQVLKGIDLHIDKGEIVSIVGPSGAGKTTLLQIIGTLDRPDGGTVSIDGIDITQLSAKKLSDFRNQHLGFVFQFHQLLPEFTALENIMIPAFIAGKSRSQAKQRAEELLAFMGLTERANHKPAQLSGGEKQRVAVARALVNNPEVILADEPSGSLDTKNKEDLHPDLIADLQEAEISNTRFHYWISVKEFVDKYANEIAQRIDDYKLLINEIEHNKTGFQEPIHGFVSSIIGMDLSDQGVLVPGVNPVLHSIEEEIVTHIEDIKDIGEEYLLDVNFECIGMIESSINQDELKDYKGEFDFEVVSKKGNIAQINTTIGLQIKLRMTFSKIEKNISSIELIEVEDYYCPFCEYE